VNVFNNLESRVDGEIVFESDKDFSDVDSNNGSFSVDAG
jgi:hypothetical protein